ncbi:MAG TPA: fatty acid desaturase [Gammaproteobacteria bacterium]|jgi:acyl-lipid omega-6 desaturase (Delta-12 desaturase)|nr:fatty acid desaturase [Gammaproteobacteria bacterium]
MSSALADLKRHKRSLIARHARASDWLGMMHVGVTLVPLALLWWIVSFAGSQSSALVVLSTLLIGLFILRCFALMHDCGHGSLFKCRALNRWFGFLFGVLSGMPQHVWSRHHQYHHATNGNWSRYRGPLATLSVDEYAALTPAQQQSYARARRLRMAPLAGLLYVVVNPRLTWLLGTVSLVNHVVRRKRSDPGASIRDHVRAFRSRHWSTSAEYRHMTLNNLTLFAVWGAMCAWIGPWLFASVYLSSTSLAGAVGIVLFTVQHNFEHSYAAGDEGWDYDRSAIHGTSYLVLPAWLNWFTANIGYHHVHHLCARIPCYRLAACHAENATLFRDVRRLRLSDVLPSLEYLLWDTNAQRIISIAEYMRTLPLCAKRN